MLADGKNVELLKFPWVGFHKPHTQRFCSRRKLDIWNMFKLLKKIPQYCF